MAKPRSSLSWALAVLLPANPFALASLPITEDPAVPVRASGDAAAAAAPISNFDEDGARAERTASTAAPPTATASSQSKSALNTDHLSTGEFFAGSRATARRRRARAIFLERAPWTFDSMRAHATKSLSELGQSSAPCCNVCTKSFCRA